MIGATAPSTRRRLLERCAATAAGVAGGGALAACNQAAQPAARPAEMAPAQLDLWHHWASTRLPLVDELGRRFNARYPQITIAHSVIQGNRVEKVLAAASAGSLPSVLMINRRELPQYTQLGFLRQLNDYAKRARIADDQFIPAEIKSSYVQGKLMTLPMVTGGDLQFVYYNRALWRQAGLDPDKNAPKTWAQLREQVRPLTVRQGADIAQLGFPVANELSRMNRLGGNWLALAGGTQVSQPDGKRSLLGSNETIRALSFLTDILRDQGGAAASAAFQPHLDLENGSQFSAGRQATAIFGVPHWFIFKTNAPDMDMGIFGLPPDTGKAHKFGAGDGWSYSVPTSTKTVDQAWALEQFLSVEEEGAGWFVLEQGRPSPVKKLNENPAFRQKHPQWNVVLDVVAKGELWTWVTPQAEIERDTGPVLAEVRDGTLSPQDGAKRMSEIAQRFIDQSATSK